VTNVDAVELRDLKWAFVHVAGSKDTRLLLRKAQSRGKVWSMSVGAGNNKTPFCLRQGKVAVIALIRSYLDGKCWLERQKFCEMVRIPHKPSINYAQTAISWMKSRSARTFAGGRWREG
jgi:hypothetical protein